MQRGFTFIELLFVILVIGVLAGIALPRYFAVKSQAQEQIAKSFAGTLTRTTGNTLWSQSLSNGGNGSIKSDEDGNDSKFYGNSLDVYITIPKYFDRTSVNFANCVPGGQSAQPFIRKNVAAGGEYNIFCRDGNKTHSPYFVASKDETYAF